MKEHEKPEDAFYVGFTDASGIRRGVLEAARAVVQTVHLHSRVRDIQDEKLKLRTDLAHIVHEVKDEMQKLENVLPKREGGPAPTQHFPRQAVRKVADHRLDKIESALAEIEQRMRGL